jgi:hypothetical protein
MKNTITVLTAAMLLGASVASALEIKSGSDKVQTKIYGEIDRAVMYADDGHQDKIFHVDNSHSETRVGLNGEVAAADYLTVGGSVELLWQANPASMVSMEAESIAGEFAEELVEMYFDFSKAGKCSLGCGGMASAGSSEIDLSGTDIAGNAGVADAGGGLAFYDAASGSYGHDGEGGATVGEAFRRQCCELFNRIAADGLGKKNRVRYDTPSLAGFSFGVAAGEEETFDAALSYAGEFGGTRLEAIAAWADHGNLDDEFGNYTQINASASVLFPFGLNFTAGFGSRDMDAMPAGGEDPVFTYGKIGWKCDQMFSVGYTAVSVDYGVYENASVLDREQKGTAAGVQFVQELAEYSTELYAACRSFALEDNTGADYEDISVIMAGARFSF